MNSPARSSIPSASKFAQRMVNQTPRYESRRIFRRKLKRGRPAQNAPRQHWLK